MMRSAFLALSSLIAATNCYPYFQYQIPNGMNIPHPCPEVRETSPFWAGVGHRNPEGAGIRNPFGMDWALNEFKWDECICKQDSDGDGKTNGEELGDPDCVWSPGMEPQETEWLSHPGVCEPLDDPKCMEKNSWLDCGLFLPFECDAFSEPDTIQVDMNIPRTEVPSEETSYYCTAMTFPDEVANADFHLVGAESLIDNPDIMHHLIVYGCPDAVASNVTEEYGAPKECGDMVTEYCDQIVFLWGFGMRPDCFGEEYGVRIGSQGVKTFVYEFHWNNPLNVEGDTDASGVRFYLTPNIRTYDAETLFFGPSVLELPPGMSSVTQTSFCPGPCMEARFPETIYIAAVYPHMHTLGRTLRMEQWRDGRLVRVIVNEDAFDYNSPRVHRFENAVVVEPGDEIRVNCTFDTTSRQEYTFYGEGTSDEMCFAITQYYPVLATASSCLSLGAEYAFCYEDYTYGYEKWMDCYLQALSSEVASATYATQTLPGYYNGLIEVCDVSGLQCLPGCKDSLEALKADPCFRNEAVSLTKVYLLELMAPYTGLGEEFTSNFNGMLLSCNDYESTNEEEKEWEEGECPFDEVEPPFPTSAAVNLKGSIILAILRLLAFL